MLRARLHEVNGAVYEIYEDEYGRIAQHEIIRPRRAADDFTAVEPPSEVTFDNALRLLNLTVRRDQYGPDSIRIIGANEAGMGHDERDAAVKWLSSNFGVYTRPHGAEAGTYIGDRYGNAAGLYAALSLYQRLMSRRNPTPLPGLDTPVSAAETGGNGGNGGAGGYG
jgi:hypothetical protein